MEYESKPPKIIAPGEIRADFRRRTRRRKNQPPNQCICSYFQYYSSMCSHPFHAKKHFKCGQTHSSKTGILVFCQPNGRIPFIDIKDVLINARCKDCRKKGDRWTNRNESDRAKDEAEGNSEEDLQAEQLRLLEGARMNLNKRGDSLSNASSNSSSNSSSTEESY